MARDGGKFVSLKHRPLLPPRNTPGTYLCQRPSRSQGHGAKGRIPVTPSGIEPATFRLVAQHINHCATAVPSAADYCVEIYRTVDLVVFMAVGVPVKGF